MSQSLLVSLTPGYFYTHTKTRITAHQQWTKRSKFKHFSPLSGYRFGFFQISIQLLQYLTDIYIFLHNLTFSSILSFVPPCRPNQLHLLFAQMSTTAPVTMMMSPCQAWPSPLRLKTSSMSKRWVPIGDDIQHNDAEGDENNVQDAQKNCV